MNKIISWIAVGISVIAILIALVGGNQPGSKLGGVTNYDEVDATALKIGGANGSRLGPIVETTCNLQANFSIAASSTRLVSCAVTGVVSGDNVEVTLPATSSMASQYIVAGATASSTAGQIDVALTNFSGTAATPAATSGFGSSTVVRISHPLTSVPGI